MNEKVFTRLLITGILLVVFSAGFALGDGRRSVRARTVRTELERELTATENTIIELEAGIKQNGVIIGDLRSENTRLRDNLNGAKTIVLDLEDLSQSDSSSITGILETIRDIKIKVENLQKYFDNIDSNNSH